jgi:hypothetical protein
LKSKTELLDHYFEAVYAVLFEKFQALTYKKVNFGKTMANFKPLNHIDNHFFIKNLNGFNLDETIEKGLNSYLVIKVHFFKSLYNLVKDLIRFLSFLKVKNTYDCHYYIFISNKKFIPFVDSIKSDLEKRNYNVGYFFWSEKDIPDNFRASFITVRPSLPNFFSKSYWLHYDYTTQIDRMYQVAKNLKGKKVIIPEGCLSSMHLLANLGVVFNFETICVQWGFFGRTATKVGWRNMPYDKFLVWGDFFKKSFQQYNHGLDIKIGGHPNLKEKSNVTKKYILIAVQRELGDHITTSDVQNFLKNIYELIRYFPNLDFVIRTHPDLPFDRLPFKVEPNGDINNYKVHDYKDFSIEDSLQQAYACIGISSTIVLESVAMQCYPIYLISNDLPLQIHEVFNVNVNHRHVFNFQELIPFLENFDYELNLEYIIGLKNILFAQNQISKYI